MRKWVYVPVDQDGGTEDGAAVARLDVVWPHDLDTCDKPICIETRRLIALRGASARRPVDVSRVRAKAARGAQA